MSRLSGFSYRDVARRMRTFGYRLDRQAQGSHEPALFTSWFVSGVARGGEAIRFKVHGPRTSGLPHVAPR